MDPKLATDTRLESMSTISSTTSMNHVSCVVIQGLESFFYHWGRFVAQRPWTVIACSLLLFLVSLGGFLNFEAESRAEKLWIPTDSPYIAHKAWMESHFPTMIRTHALMFRAEHDILTPEGLRAMHQLHTQIGLIRAYNSSWNDLCFRVPVVDLFLRRKKRQAVSAFSPEESFELNRVVPDPNEKNQNENLIASTTPASLESVWASEYDYGEYAYEEEYEEDSSQSQSTSLDTELPPEIYCDLVETLEDRCLENSLLELWRFDPLSLESITKEDILRAINAGSQSSPVYGYQFDYSRLLGDIKRNESGHIIAAKSALVTLHTQVDPELGLGAEGLAGVELDLADPISLAWEKRVIETSLKSQFKENINVHINVGRSYNDITSEAVFFDAFKMVAGYGLMFVYTMLMLGRLNRLEHRTHLAMAGIVAVCMGLVMAYAISGALGMPYTPIHAILPFLCLGIGIDDMFVIMQCWHNLADSGLEPRERIGQTLKHAGVAITVTSLTDVCAFSVGAFTILPGLKAFCVSCAVGIGCIYVLQGSWFVAWLTLDEKRISNRKDALFPCLKLSDHWKPSQLSQKEISKHLMQTVANWLFTWPFKTLVLVVTSLLLVLGVSGSLMIRQKFDPILLLPAESYLRQFIDAHESDFPSKGWSADVYTGPIGLEDLEHLDKLVLQLEDLAKQRIFLRDVDSWWSEFKAFLAENHNNNENNKNNNKNNNNSVNNQSVEWRSLLVDESRFHWLLSEFLFSRRGSKFKLNFQLSEPLVCNEPVANITASKFTVHYLWFTSPEQHIPARRGVEKLIQSANIGSEVFSFSKVYAAWETDEVIGFELWRNLALAMLAVFAITLSLLANLRVCLLVLLCVVLTLVNLVGMLHFWSLTIDVISCINIVLAIGLCVDYSAHIAHAYIVAEGTSEERAKSSLISMGPAILNGGITTFLALFLMGFSNSHAFLVFFKVFTLTVVFGLFHGLIFLPVVLGLVGGVHDNHRDVDKNRMETNLCNQGYVDDQLPARKLFSLLGGRNASWDLQQAPQDENKVVDLV